MYAFAHIALLDYSTVGSTAEIPGWKFYKYDASDSIEIINNCIGITIPFSALSKSD